MSKLACVVLYPELSEDAIRPTVAGALYSYQINGVAIQSEGFVSTGVPAEWGLLA